MTTVTKPGSAKFRLSLEFWKNSKLYSSGDKYQVTKTWNDVRIGTENNAWRDAVGNHHPATTNMSATTRSYTPAQITTYSNVDKCIETSNQVWHEHGSGTIPLAGIPDTPSSFDANSADRTARQKFVQHYRQRRTAFQGGVFLGELAETISLLTNPARALRKGIDSYYKTVKKRLKKEKNPRKRPRIPSDTWLEYNFGWRPLVSDIRDAAGLLTADPYAVFLPLSGTGTETWKSEPDDNNLYTTTFLHFRVRATKINTVQVRYIGQIGAENNPPGFPEQLGLDWSNLAPTIWELIPYSFLVDYFSNVGKVIEGASTGTIRLAWGNKTVRRMSELYNEAFLLDKEQLGYPDNKWTYYVHGGGRVGHYKNVDRTGANNVSFGLGDISFKLPGTSSKWLNIAALADMRR